MAKMKWYQTTAIVLVGIGAVNWGLVGINNFDLVTKIFGSYAKWIFDLVGIAGIYTLAWLFFGKKN